jgi:hypothetical protein
MIAGIICIVVMTIALILFFIQNKKDEVKRREQEERLKDENIYDPETGEKISIESADGINPEHGDANAFLINTLQEKIIGMGFKVERHPQYLGLIVNSDLEIATAIVNNPDAHPSILQLMTLTIHQKYFPKGIEESMIGVGLTIEEKVDSVVKNYLSAIFESVIESFSERHNPDLDFSNTIEGREILWHPKPGNLLLQGQWKSVPHENHVFNLLKEHAKSKLALQKFNWIKVYISKQANGTIIGDCLFNNEQWKEGLEIVSNYARTWNEEGEFFGLKQFIMFRRCDVHDH